MKNKRQEVKNLLKYTGKTKAKVKVDKKTGLWHICSK